MKYEITRRRFLAASSAVLAAPAIVTMVRPARAGTTLTLGHGAAPGNPRTVAAAKFAELVAEKTAARVTTMWPARKHSAATPRC